MNEKFSEEQETSLTEQSVEKALPVEENPADTLVETLRQVDEIQDVNKTEGASSEVSMVEGVAERISATPEQMEAAKTEVNFTERRAALEGKKKSIKDTFDAGVRKALLPVATAFALGGSPALAEVGETGKIVDQPETSLVAPETRGEKKELAFDQVFDKSSPLAQSSEKIKNERPISSEELVTLKDLHQKVWKGKNEWAAFSKRDKSGKYTVVLEEMGPTGGLFEMEDSKEDETEKVFTHTHPVEAAYSIGRSAQEIREGKKRPFIMPPSTADFSQCIDGTRNGVLQRVVDSRGVWEYTCDENGAFARMRKDLDARVIARVEEVKAEYKVKDEDVEQAMALVKNEHPIALAQTLFSELDKKYSGIAGKGNDIALEVGSWAQEFGSSVLAHETDGVALSQSSMELSDEELVPRIKSFIKAAEKRGMTLRYIPFKEIPKE